jgi:uncharacterized protein YgiM (DUF1202 family)
MTPVALLTALALWAAPAPAKELFTQRTETFVREAASGYSTVVVVLPVGTKLAVLEDQGRWLKVQAKDKTGFVAANALDAAPSKETKAGSGPASKELTPTQVAAAIRGFGKPAQTEDGGSVEDVMIAIEKGFSWNEYQAFRRETLAKMASGYGPGKHPSGVSAREYPYPLLLQEEGIGAGIASRFGKRLIKESEIAKYINLVGAWLSEQSQAYGWQFHFILIEDPQVNAWSLPGGFILVTRGAISFCKDESELAGLLAHEIAHNLLGHARIVMKMNEVRAKRDKAMDELDNDMPEDESEKEVSQELSAWADQAWAKVQQPKTQELEKEADSLATLLLWQAGYDATGLSRVIERASQAHEETDFFSSEIKTKDLTAQRFSGAKSYCTKYFAKSGGGRFEERYHARTR